MPDCLSCQILLTVMASGCVSSCYIHSVPSYVYMTDDGRIDLDTHSCYWYRSIFSQSIWIILFSFNPIASNKWYLSLSSLLLTSRNLYLFIIAQMWHSCTMHYATVSMDMQSWFAKWCQKCCCMASIWFFRNYAQCRMQQLFVQLLLDWQW